MVGLEVEVEQALGPGIDLERDVRGGLIGRRARAGIGWLGFDRAALVDSDDGRGRSVPVLVALPASTFAGCRLEIELVGAWRTRDAAILLGRVAGAPLPPVSLARIAAGLDEATWLSGDAAEQLARQGRQRFRERQSHARIRGGRAWHASGTLPPELARYATPHSVAEYSLARLPDRFVRGLADLLDGDERILYWVERPMAGDLGTLERLRRRIDRRAALLLLTDRQLLWLVDHAKPDRYLSDWGVDVEIVPVERLLGATCADGDDAIGLQVATPAGPRSYVLPGELREEARFMAELLTRFTPAAARGLPRRRYPVEPIAFDRAAAALFDQEAEARKWYDTATASGEVLAFLFSPRRPGQRSPAALILRPTAIELAASDRRRSIAVSDVVAVSLTLSPLVGRLSVGPDVGLTYPAPFAERGAALVRLARRVMANVA